MAGMRVKQIAGAIAAVALCFSPTMATAATSAPAPSLNPLVAVGVFGTPASAQVAAQSGALAMAQQTVPGGGPVLPQGDPPPPPPPPEGDVQPRGFGISPVILGLLGIAIIAALIALSNDDSDSPASPS